jgi:hypothetical protein
MTCISVKNAATCMKTLLLAFPSISDQLVWKDMHRVLVEKVKDLR